MSALGQYHFNGSEVPSRLDSKANIAVSLGMSAFEPMAGHGPPHSITSSARASNLSQTKASALVPGICLQESALLPAEMTPIAGRFQRCAVSKLFMLADYLAALQSDSIRIRTARSPPAALRE